MKFTVETADLRDALRAVTPHADPEPDITKFHRVRVEVGPVNVTVSATNGYSLAHALVSMWDNEDGELAAFDLTPQDVREILLVFKGGKAGEDLPDETLMLEVDDEHTTITDVGGLFPGKQLRLARYPNHDSFPDVAALIGKALTRDAVATDRLVTSATLLGLFLKAAAAYKEPLVIDTAGEAGALLISCGESFIGLLMPQRPDDEKTAEIADWHAGWMRRITERAPADNAPVGE